MQAVTYLNLLEDIKKLRAQNRALLKTVDNRAAYLKLYDLWDENKKSPRVEYMDELIEQLMLFGIESNTLTRQYLREKLQDVINKYNAIDNRKKS